MILFAGIRLLFPIMVALLLLIISSVPIDVAGASAFFPVVDVMAIYYWTSYRPGALPDWFIFLLGILRDSIEGIAIGISPCVYLIIRLIVASSRGLYRKGSFLIIWQGFAVMALIAIVGKWLLLSFLMDTPLVLDSAIMQLMVSIAMYPVFHWFFNLVNLIMPEKFQDA